MKTITCPDCGTEILILPDLKEMNKTIENHINKHRNGTIKGTLSCIKIRHSLAQQVLMKVSE